MNLTAVSILLPLISFAILLLITPFIRRQAVKAGLVDKPNARKVHQTPIPLIGGIVVFISAALSLLFIARPYADSRTLVVLAGGAAALLAIGIVDDKKDLRASVKLMLQIALAYWVFASGIRLDSFFGILGIQQLPTSMQYVLTILIIAGVVNAFNLTDGIDGLAAGLAIVGLTAFTAVAFMVGQVFLGLINLSLAGALLGFLRFNLHPGARKIFMGDAGSLALGFILVVSGLILIQSAKGTGNITLTLTTVIGVLAIPVIDSLRVYRRRIKTGYSPFRADKTHLHHLVLQLGMKHKSASAVIILLAVGILLVTVIFGEYFSVTISIIALLLIFILVSSFLAFKRELSLWSVRIRDMEKR